MFVCLFVWMSMFYQRLRVIQRVGLGCWSKPYSLRKEGWDRFIFCLPKLSSNTLNLTNNCISLFPSSNRSNWVLLLEAILLEKTGIKPQQLRWDISSLLTDYSPCLTSPLLVSSSVYWNQTTTFLTYRSEVNLVPWIVWLAVANLRTAGTGALELIESDLSSMLGTRSKVLDGLQYLVSVVSS